MKKDISVGTNKKILVTNAYLTKNKEKESKEVEDPAIINERGVDEVVIKKDDKMDTVSEEKLHCGDEPEGKMVFAGRVAEVVPRTDFRCHHFMATIFTITVFFVTLVKRKRTSKKRKRIEKRGVLDEAVADEKEDLVSKIVPKRSIENNATNLNENIVVVDNPFV